MQTEAISAHAQESRHFPTHTLATAPEASRPLLEATERIFGFIPRASARHATAPALLTAFAQLLDVFEHTSLTPLEREAVALVLAGKLDCALCQTLHTGLARRLGARAELVTSLIARRNIEDPGLAALAHFTERVVDTRGAVSEAELETFVEAGFSARKALEVVVGVATYTLSIFANRMTRTATLK